MKVIPFQKIEPGEFFTVSHSPFDGYVPVFIRIKNGKFNAFCLSSSTFAYISEDVDWSFTLLDVEDIENFHTLIHEYKFN